jgi:hypothetical protein
MLETVMKNVMESAAGSAAALPAGARAMPLKDQRELSFL